jgi:uroporphyrinogen-III decarboxylase
MIDVTAFTQYAQRHLILTALTRAGNRQAQVVQDALVTDRDAERAKYYALLEAVSQADTACDRALLTIASAVVASDQPFSDITNMLNDIGIDSSPNTALTIDIVRELQAITKEAQ